MMGRVLEQMIMQNKYRNKGYIIDGFPKNNTGCDAFLRKYSNKAYKEIFPNTIYVFGDLTPEEMKKRALTMAETDERYLLANVVRRLELYNGGESGKKPIDFFEENGIEVNKIEPDWPADKIVEQAVLVTVFK